MARRGTSRRKRRRVTSNRSRAFFLHYRTPGGQKKVARLGNNASAATARLENWKSRVRGKGYRVLKVFTASSLAAARKACAPKRRTTAQRTRRNSRRRATRRRSTRRRATRRNSRRRHASRRRTSRRRAA